MNYSEMLAKSSFASAHESLQSAYVRGLQSGHGIACHNVPELGAKLNTDSLGRVTVDADNIREVHESLCFEAESSSRDFSPFEFTAHEFNQAGEDDDETPGSDELWEAYDAGIAEAIQADLSTYSNEDYGIPPPFDGESFTGPSAWASYLVNGDASGISDEEAREADAASEGLGNCVDAIECGFMHRPDYGMAGDCCEYRFMK